MSDIKALQLIIDRGIESLGRYYGPHRGVVQDTPDPENLNRLLVWLPDIPNAPRVWAYAKGQQGSSNSGFKYLTPSPGDLVYVTFEYGDISKALWEFHGWGKGECPPQLLSPSTGGFITPRGNMILFNETDDSLEISFKGDIRIASAKSVTLEGETVQLKGSMGIIMGEGDNSGLVNVVTLTNRLNYLLQELNKLKSEISTHTHAGVMTGAAMSGPPAVPLTTVFTPFQETDYQDTSIIH